MNVSLPNTLCILFRYDSLGRFGFEDEFDQEFRDEVKIVDHFGFQLGFNHFYKWSKYLLKVLVNV